MPAAVASPATAVEDFCGGRAIAGTMGRLARLNARLADTSLAAQATIGALIVAVVSTVLSLENGPTWAIASGLVSGVVVGAAYYLGLRAGAAYRD